MGKWKRIIIGGIWGLLSIFANQLPNYGLYKIFPDVFAYLVLRFLMVPIIIGGFVASNILEVFYTFNLMAPPPLDCFGSGCMAGIPHMILFFIIAIPIGIAIGALIVLGSGLVFDCYLAIHFLYTRWSKLAQPNCKLICT